MICAAAIVLAPILAALLNNLQDDPFLGISVARHDQYQSLLFGEELGNFPQGLSTLFDVIHRITSTLRGFDSAYLKNLRF